jgi:hypothetical protein
MKTAIATEMDPEIKLLNSQINLKKDKSLNLIRKLGTIESLYDYEVLNGSLILARTFLVTLPKIYSLNLNLLEQACSYWIKRHPFLQSYVYSTGGDLTVQDFFDINYPKYYAFMNKNISEYNNLEYLETKNPHEWKNIMESELKNPFDYSNGPLWRLKLVKISDHFDHFFTNDESNYAFILSNSHVIGDGRNLIKIMLELFNIINSLLLNKTCDEMLSRFVVESKYSIEDLVENKPLPIQINESSRDFNPCVSAKTGQKINGLKQNYDYLFFKSEKINKLIKKSKQFTNDAKLTGILSTILCFSMKKLFKKYEVNDIDFNNMNYEVLASLRDKFGVSESQMGVYSVALESQINLNELNSKSFWKITEKQSIMLHERLKKNEDVYYVDCRQTIDILNGGELNLGVCNMFAFSNIGRIDYKNNGDLPIKLKQHFIIQSLRDYSSSGLFFNGISSTSNNDLCWSFSYLENYYSNKFIKELKYLIVSFIEQLIAENEA